MSDDINGRLQSWKEIAAYLGCDVRTCLRWEKERGLPVHRPGGKPGPRVVAFKKELDVWLSGGARTAAETESPREALSPPAERDSISRRWIFIPALLLILGGLGYLGIRALTTDREPADFTIEGSRLIIQNKARKALWTFDTKRENLWSETRYRKSFQSRQWDNENGFNYAPSLVIEDLDKDGHAEVLFAAHADVLQNSNRLVCFDHRGRERWHFEGGREMVFGPKPYSGDYFLTFEAHDLDGDGRLEVFALSEQIDDFPTQLVLLSHDGQRLGEYWHCGRITDLRLEDLDSDIKPELLLGGVNNEYKKAFFAILNPWKLAGQSPNSDLKCPSLAAGSEQAYALLPDTDIDPYEGVLTVLGLIRRLANGRIETRTWKTQMIYEVDAKTLACLDVVYSNTYRALHEKAVLAGVAHAVLDDAYREKLMKSFLYWTGREWTSTPGWIVPRP